MRNVVPLAAISALQFLFVLGATWFAWQYNLGNTDMVNTAYVILLAGMTFGVLYISWRKGTGLDLAVVFLSPLISYEILNQNSHWLSPMFPGYLVYGVVTLLIWVTIAVAMKIAFAVVQRFFP